MLIALDILMLNYESTRHFDVPLTVQRLRHDRAGLVQTREQYKLVYRVACEYARMLNNPMTSARSSLSSASVAFYV